MISVVLVTYNRADFLRDAINDILNQKYQNFELIICDDASPDHTSQVVDSFVDERITYLKSSVNRGMPGNLIEGLKMAKFEFIAILHDGDRFSDILLKRWFDAIKYNEKVGIVFNPLMTFDSKGNNYFTKQIFSEGAIEGSKLLKEYYFNNYQFPSPIWGEAMIRRNALIDINSPDIRFGFYADVDMWMAILQKYDAYYCSDYLIKCPTKDLQPHQFDDRLIKSSFILMDMHFKQRIKYFKRFPIYGLWLVLKLIIQSCFNYVYTNLIILKNQSTSDFINAVKYTIKNKPYLVLLIPSILFFYPFVILLLKIKQFINGSYYFKR